MVLVIKPVGYFVQNEIVCCDILYLSDDASPFITDDERSIKLTTVTPKFVEKC